MSLTECSRSHVSAHLTGAEACYGPLFGRQLDARPMAGPGEWRCVLVLGGLVRHRGVLSPVPLHGTTKVIVRRRSQPDGYQDELRQRLHQRRGDLAQGRVLGQILRMNWSFDCFMYLFDPHLASGCGGALG
jgi:hypothetical protein